MLFAKSGVLFTFLVLACDFAGAISTLLTKLTFKLAGNGAAGATRTPDLVLRRHALYPAELQPRTSFISCVLGYVHGCPAILI